MKKVLFYWIPFALFLFVLYYFSTVSKPLSVSFNLSFIHFFEFLFLGFLFLRLVNSYGIKNKFVFTIFFVTFLGLVDEIIQGYTPGRVSCLSDVLIDFIGACFVVVFKFKKLRWLIR